MQALAALKDKTSGTVHLVSMHHLKAKKPHAELREAQAVAVMERVREGVAAVAGLQPGDPAASVIVCGDFNADWEEPCVQRTLAELELKSAYGDGGEPTWTTWKYRKPSAMGKGGLQKHTIDYILVGRPLDALELWSIPPDEAVQELGLPCPQYGSDHLAIAAKLRAAAPERD